MNAHELVQEVGTLFSLPDVVVRLNELIESGEATTAELGEVVELDPGLAAAVLKLANSAWYGLPSHVDTLSTAVMLVGQKALRTLALSASVVKTFRGIPENLLDMRAFWDGSIACGVMARNLGRTCRVPEEERLFIAGLLLGVGKLVFLARRPTQYRDVLALAGEGDAAMVAAERRLFGFDYAELGSELLRTWKLPEILPFLVGSHLAPHAAKAWPREAAVVFAAAAIATTIAPAIHGSAPLAGFDLEFEPEVWSRLAIQPAMIPEVITASVAQARELAEIVNAG
jgi:HD-like signal output (HDOD) protein